MNKNQHLTPKQASRRIGQIDSALVPGLFKALCDPTRSRLLACLAKCGRACSVGEVAECCSVDFSVVSRHLALLARAGVLESQKQGRTVNYIVRYSDIAASLRSLADAFEQCCPADACSAGEGCCAAPQAEPGTRNVRPSNGSNLSRRGSK
ncbi:MAG: winged helix-turn-helix transcriptional regulator [Planctomycetes bacterium]|nr:winged helix-turn-helix transcriptional regulator [Planctomycetota bacterium]